MTERPDLTPVTLAVLNWYRQKQGFSPLDARTMPVVSEEEWAKMSKAAKAELWTKHPTQERP